MINRSPSKCSCSAFIVHGSAWWPRGRIMTGESCFKSRVYTLHSVKLAVNALPINNSSLQSTKFFPQQKRVKPISSGNKEWIEFENTHRNFMHKIVKLCVLVSVFFKLYHSPKRLTLRPRLTRPVIARIFCSCPSTNRTDDLLTFILTVSKFRFLFS